jgi:hypothetical protein
MKPIFAFTISAAVTCAIALAAQTRQTNQTSVKAPPSSAVKTFNGCLQRNAAGGYTLSNAHNDKAARDTAPRPTPAVYEVVTADGLKVDLAAMANQHVEIVGMVALVKVTDKTGKPRVVTVEEIKIVPGGC